MIRFEPHHRLTRRLAIRPPGYLDEIAPAIVSSSTAGITIDTDHPACIAAMAKYRRKPNRTAKRSPAELAAAIAQRASLRAECERIGAVCQAHRERCEADPHATEADLQAYDCCTFRDQTSCTRREQVKQRTARCHVGLWTLTPEDENNGE